jgi:hypothetical protein
MTVSNDGNFIMECCLYCASHRKYQVTRPVMMSQNKFKSLFSTYSHVIITPGHIKPINILCGEIKSLLTSSQVIHIVTTLL